MVIYLDYLSVRLRQRAYRYILLIASGIMFDLLRQRFAIVLCWGDVISIEKGCSDNNLLNRLDVKIQNHRGQWLYSNATDTRKLKNAVCSSVIHMRLLESIGKLVRST